jgi:hypothetical protein
MGRYLFLRPPRVARGLEVAFLLEAHTSSAKRGSYFNDN